MGIGSFFLFFILYANDLHLLSRAVRNFRCDLKFYKPLCCYCSIVSCYVSIVEWCTMTSSSLLPGLTSMFIYPREALFFHGRAYACTCMRNNRHSTIHSYLAPFGSPRISETKLHISLTAFLLGTRQKNKLQNHRESPINQTQAY